MEHEAQTLVDLLSVAARNWPNQTALSLHGAEGFGWTYAELQRSAQTIAAFLQRAGVGHGDRVILWGANRPEWVAAFFGTLLAGGVVVPLDVRSREELLTDIEQQTQPRYGFVGRAQAKELQGSHTSLSVFEDLRDTLLSEPPQSPATVSVDANDLAELVFTSGTTGNPKGVMLSHRNIAANVAMGRPAFPPTTNSQVLSILPLSHMFEQVGGLLVPMTGGASLTYVSSLRPDVIFAAMVNRKVTNMTCVPQVLGLFREGIEREIRRQGRTAQFERFHAIGLHLPLWVRRRLFSSLHKRMGGHFQYFVSGGAHLEAGLARWWEGLGIKVAQGYGMTEASPVVATNTLRDRDFDSVGRPVSGVTIRIAEDQEILVQGENVSQGYWQNPEATADVFVDGWYKTGDLGFLDKAGRLHLHGRKKNVIVLASGLNVYPEDIERVLTADARIKDAVVLGLTHGQDVEVHAVLLTDEPEAAPDVVRTANARLAPQQHIRAHTIWPDESFPMTPTLKVKRGPVAERLELIRSKQPSGSAKPTA